MKTTIPTAATLGTLALAALGCQGEIDSNKPKPSTTKITSTTHPVPDASSTGDMPVSTQPDSAAIIVTTPHDSDDDGPCEEASGFKIYYNVDERRVVNRGEAEAMQAVPPGLGGWIPMIPNKYFRELYNGSWLDVSPRNIRTWLNEWNIPRTYDGMILLDYEPWAPSQPWEKDAGIDAMIKVVDVVRQRLPNAKIGLHGIPTIRVQAAGDGRPKFQQHEYWQDIWPHVDFIAPQMYTDSSEWPTSALKWYMKVASEAASSSNDKPMFPVVRMRTTKLKWIDAEVVNERVLLLRELGASGVIVWDYKTSRDDEPDRPIAERLRGLVEATGNGE